MNRLDQLLPSLEPPASPQPRLSGAARFSTQRDTACSLFMPLHYESNYAYPLLIWLHGPGDSDQQLKRIMPLVSVRNYVAVAPRGLPGHSSAGGASAWSWPDSLLCSSQIEQRVLQSIELARRKANIAKNRIFLAGYGDGGTAALRVATLVPDRFAGVLSVAGPFPRGGNPLARLERVRRVPIFLACGQRAIRYPMESVCADLRLLHSAGMTVSLRVYPCGDGMDPHMLADMDRWIMEQLSASQPVIKD
jgi:phospholipase/carboxylesterase